MKNYCSECGTILETDDYFDEFIECPVCGRKNIVSQVEMFGMHVENIEDNTDESD